MTGWLSPVVGVVTLLAPLLLSGCGHDGAPQYPTGASAAQTTYGQCAFCHDGLANHMVASGGHRNLDIKCELCHVDQSPGAVGPGHRRVPACAECHTVEQTHHDAAAGTAQACVSCHTPHGSNNLQLIRQRIDTPNGGLRPLRFVSREGLADGSFVSSTQPGTGVCETCHTQTAHYRADGSGTAHFTTTCVSCHTHARAFAAPPVPATATPSATRSVTSTRTASPSPTAPPTNTSTATAPSTATATATPTGPTPTASPSPTGPTATATATEIATSSPTPTATEPTSTPTIVLLRASRVAAPPTGIDDPLWANATMLRPTLGNVSTGLLNGDGQLNGSDTFGGLTDFNGGDPADLELRAVHDGDRLFILAQWSDRSFDVDRERWLFNGPPDPRKPAEAATGWTSQRSGDKLALAFEIEAASSEFGSFAAAGCAAACHNTAAAGGLDMRPAQGSVDLWNWSTALSEPLGFVADGVSRALDGRRDDNGTALATRNIGVSGNHRSGPASEWDGSLQNLLRGDGTAATVDAAAYILTGHDMAFSGDAAAGNVAYQSACAVCHGSSGAGGIGPAVNTPEMARSTRAQIENLIVAAGHAGAGAYNALSADNKVNLLARMRGITGVPGYILTTPGGSGADVVSQSNVDVSTVTSGEWTQYRVVMSRKLQTGHDDDAQFSAGSEYAFGVALMDNDGGNHIGSAHEILALDP